ncbi:MAG: putative RDD family membrane protein YckC [Desulforhopalus sp.]|jgi:uncharacterized RDD family membrane protein YckC
MDASYPRFIRRVKAALIDSFIIAILVVFCVAALAESESVPSYFKIFIILLPIFIIEPLFVALTGGSPGHHLFNIKIRGKSEDKKLSIQKSILRFFLKVLLGFISLPLVIITRKNLILHDIASGSIVDFKYPEPAKDKIDLEISYISKGIIKSEYLDRGVFTIDGKAIHFGKPNSKTVYFCYLFIATLFYLTMFGVILHFGDNTATCLFMFITIYCSSMFILPIKDMLLSDQVYVDFKKGEISTTSVFGKKKNYPFLNVSDISFDYGVYWSRRAHSWKLILINKKRKFIVARDISFRKEAIQLCEILKTFKQFAVDEESCENVELLKDLSLI